MALSGWASGNKARPASVVDPRSGVESEPQSTGNPNSQSARGDGVHPPPSQPAECRSRGCCRCCCDIKASALGPASASEEGTASEAGMEVNSDMQAEKVQAWQLGGKGQAERFARYPGQIIFGAHKFQDWRGMGTQMLSDEM